MYGCTYALADHQKLGQLLIAEILSALCFSYVYEKISAVTGAHYFPLLLLNVICSLEMHRAIWLPFGWQIIKLEVSRNRATCLFW